VPLKGIRVEIGRENGKRVRIAFTLDCRDREAISWAATIGGIASDGGLMIESSTTRSGPANRLPLPVDGCRITARPYTVGESRALAHEVGLAPLTTLRCAPLQRDPYLSNTDDPPLSARHAEYTVI
jgi:putative transposase